MRYVVKVTKTYYGKPDRPTLLRQEDNPKFAKVFATEHDAYEAFRGEEEQVYLQDHNEYGRPYFEVIAMDKISRGLRYLVHDHDL